MKAETLAPVQKVHSVVARPGARKLESGEVSMMAMTDPSRHRAMCTNRARVKALPSPKINLPPLLSHSLSLSSPSPLPLLR